MSKEEIKKPPMTFINWWLVVLMKDGTVCKGLLTGVGKRKLSLDIHNGGKGKIPIRKIKNYFQPTEEAVKCWK